MPLFFTAHHTGHFSRHPVPAHKTFSPQKISILYILLCILLTRTLLRSSSGPSTRVKSFFICFNNYVFPTLAKHTTQPSSTSSQLLNTWLPLLSSLPAVLPPSTSLASVLQLLLSSSQSSTSSASRDPIDSAPYTVPAVAAAAAASVSILLAAVSISILCIIHRNFVSL